MTTHVSLKSARYRLDDLVVDEGQRRVFRGDQEIELPKLSFSMLIALIRAAPNALSIDELSDQVWDGAVVSPATVAKRAELLRQALGEDSKDSRYVALVRSHGYRLIPTPVYGSPAAGAGTRKALFLAAALVAIIAGLGWYLVIANQAPPSRSIAVLPFVNISGEPESEYLSDGLATELTGLMTTIPDLKVAARTSAFAFKGRDVDVTEIAGELRVEHILSGSVQQSGDRLRITAHLVNGMDGYFVWSDSWDRRLTDIFDIQDEIAESVVNALQLQLTRDVPESQRTDPRAYAYYLKSRNAYYENREPDVGETGPERQAHALSLITHALAIDPDFAAAWGALASIQFNQALWMHVDQAETYAQAEASARRALALDPHQVTALFVLGALADTWYWDSVSAARWYKRALEVAPGHTGTRNAVAVLYGRLGRNQLAHRYHLRTYDSDPLNSQVSLNLALSYWQQDKFEAAREQLELARQLEPNAVRVLVFEGLFAYLEGKYEKASELFDDLNEPLQVCALQSAQRSEQAQKVYDTMLQGQPVTALSKAVVQSCFNDKESAFALLQIAYENHDPALRWLRNNQALENLHDDPRWEELVRKVGVSDEAADIVFAELGELGL